MAARITIAGPSCLLNPLSAWASLDGGARGYHLALSDPTAEAGDPAMAGAIFDYECDGGYLEFVTVAPNLNCDISTKTSVVSSYEQYQTERSREVSTETSANADMEATFKGVKAKASVATSNKQSGVQKDVLDSFKSGKSEVSLARATCTTVDMRISSVSRPKFTASFLAGLRELELNAGALDAQRKAKYQAFIRTYGTHLINSAKFGSSIESTRIYGARSGSLLQRQTRQGCTSQSVEGCVGAGFGTSSVSADVEGYVNQNTTECESSMNQQGNGGTGSGVKVSLTSRGSPPLDLSLWEKTAFSPVPVVLRLTPIENILTQDNLNADQDYGIDAAFNAQTVVNALKEGMQNGWYMCSTADCPAQLTPAEISSPQDKGCGINDDCQPGQKCVDDASANGFQCQETAGLCDTFSLRFMDSPYDFTPVYLKRQPLSPNLIMASDSNHDDWRIASSGDCDVEILTAGGFPSEMIECHADIGCQMVIFSMAGATTFQLEGSNVRHGAVVEFRALDGSHLGYSLGGGVELRDKAPFNNRWEITCYG